MKSLKLMVLLVFAASVTAFAQWPTPELKKITPQPLPRNHQFKEFTKDTLSIVGVGDIMMGTIYPESGMHLPEDPFNILDKVSYHLKDADLTFGNLEGSFSNFQVDGEMKQCQDSTKCYAFRMPESYGQILVNNGFDVVSVSNNHVSDFGKTGRTRCMMTLDRIGMEYAGLLEKQYAIFEKDGVRYGFAAFSPNNGTVRINDYKKAVEIVKALERSTDIVIVSFHGGAEGPKHRHVPGKIEKFYGENRGNVSQFAHLMIDNGADIVFGHGPHVTRAVELYKDRFVAYSMGNFCTYHRFNLTGHAGVAPLVRLNVRKDGSFVDGTLVPIKQIGEGIPVVDPRKTAIREVKELTSADFPKTDLYIDVNSGRMVRKSEKDIAKQSR
ncbi:CapA family protein [Limibacter armeniacum]|uniref:CapA family protein n=1 Tax=Limibacter armeniacum TaxID=466084 RepID=UPI002FE5E021